MCIRDRTGGGTALAGRFDTGWPWMADYGTVTCNTLQRLYCFEIGHSFAVTQTPTSGRVVFLSKSIAQIGVAGFDMTCATDAAAANLTGTYVAAIAATTATLASRLSA